MRAFQEGVLTSSDRVRPVLTMELSRFYHGELAPALLKRIGHLARTSNHWTLVSGDAAYQGNKPCPDQAAAIWQPLVTRAVTLGRLIVGQQLLAQVADL